MLADLTDAVQLSDPQVARAGVDSGQYTAAIIIPADFTRRLAYTPEHPQVEPVAVEVYANKGRGVSAELIRSAVSAVTGQIAAGSIAIAAVGDQLAERARSDPTLGLRLAGALTDGSIRPDLACTFSAAFTPIQIDSSVAGSSLALNILTLVGAGQAMFFMLLAAQEGATAIFIERRQGTLQRLLVSPTPRLIILLGKLVGTFVNCVVQLVLLFVALSLVGSLLSGRLLSIWGNDYLAVILVILAGTLAACGFGTVILALARTPEQGSLLATVFSVAFAVMGGAFGASLPRETAQFSMVYWATDAFAKLSAGHGDITLNLLVLVVQGGITFLVGVWLFNRRLES
jgi:ABC-2 type transport system permease protein